MADSRRFLVLFTNNYPFGQGEYFLENEIPVIAKSFEKIIIIASSKNHDQTREIPANCLAYNCPITKNKLLRLKLSLKNFSTLKRIAATDWKFINCQNKKWQRLRLRALTTIMLWGEEKLAAASPLIKDLPPEETVLYSYWMDYNSYAVSRLKNSVPAYRALSRAHGCDLYSERLESDYLPLRSYLAQSLDQTVFISKHGANYFQRKVAGVSNSLVSRLGTKRTNEVLSPSSAGAGKQLLSVSNLIPLKQVHLIIEALACCQSKWHWTHFGDGPERAQLEALAQAKNIDFHFMGAVSNQTILDFYTTNPVDYFINVSSTEGLPVSIMEALSFGVPAIAPAINGIPEIVSENVGHLLSPVPTVQEIAAVLDNLASMSPEDQLRLRKNARTFWEAEYDADVVFARFVNILILKGI